MKYILYIKQESTGFIRTRIRELLPAQFEKLIVKLNKREKDFTLIKIELIDAD
jgi:hypothetical protein